ncbi:MAG: hypothetical protein A2066_12950 [Bacteroidetes bacterium GWB2_41_8]|nr:MAG: hypothetical protein A2066_12950 [Bacteroidetes bacterium GWB2_41_8]
MYHIISLAHTNKTDKFITLWRPNNAGYCYSKPMAGIYEKPEKGYHDSDSNMPITVDQADKLFIEAKYDGELRMMIPNCKQVWDVLNVKMTKNGLQKLKGPIYTDKQFDEDCDVMGKALGLR